MKKLILTSLLFIGLIAGSIAQNQLSKVSFYDNFSQIDEIQAIIKANGLEGTAGLFLTNDNNPIGLKAAVINALLTSDKANNAETFTMFLGRKYGVNFKELDYNTLNASDVFCLGYITLISGENALPILEKAQEMSPNSKTVQFIGSIAKAQAEINNGNNCEAWKVYSKTASNTALNNDLDNTIKSAFDNAMSQYQSSCN